MDLDTTNGCAAANRGLGDALEEALGPQKSTVDKLANAGKTWEPPVGGFSTARAGPRSGRKQGLKMREGVITAWKQSSPLLG